jgi:hypothetical protein
MWNLSSVYTFHGWLYCDCTPNNKRDDNDHEGCHKGPRLSLQHDLEIHTLDCALKNIVVYMSKFLVIKSHWQLVCLSIHLFYTFPIMPCWVHKIAKLLKTKVGIKFSIMSKQIGLATFYPFHFSKWRESRMDWLKKIMNYVNYLLLKRKGIDVNMKQYG